MPPTETSSPRESETTAPAFSRGSTLFLLLLALSTRLPFFFRYEIDGDEGTFIVLGNALAHGHLPYFDYWDLKPPLLFVFFAAVIAVAGLHVEAIRLAGALWVFLAAFLLRRIGARFVSPAAANLAAVFLVVSMSVVASGQAVMSELVALVPLLGGLLLLSRPRTTGSTTFCAGCLLATTALVRLNLGFAAVAAAIWILSTGRDPTWTRKARALGLFGLGGAAVVAAVSLPYVRSGAGGVLWTALFEAPLGHASGRQAGSLAVFQRLLRYAFGGNDGFRPSSGMLWVGLVVWLGGAAGAVLLAREWRRRSAPDRNALTLLAGVAVATFASILAGGANEHYHYLIQLFPFFCLPAAHFFVSAARSRAGKAAVLGVMLAAAGVCAMPVVNEAGDLIARHRSGTKWAHGTTLDLTEYLQRRCGPSCPVYLLVDQLAYALLSSPPPIPLVTHPSNLAKKPLVRALSGPRATPGSEMARILALRPRFIVRAERVVYLEGTPAGELLERALADEYELDATIAGRFVYRRKEPPPAI